MLKDRRKIGVHKLIYLSHIMSYHTKHGKNGDLKAKDEHP